MREVPCPACNGARLKPIIARGDAGRASRSPRSAALPIGECAEFLRDLELSRAGAPDRRAGAQGGQRAAAVPARRGAGLPVPGPAGRRRWPAARRSGSGSPPRSGPAWSACSTCWTSPVIGLHQRDNHRLIETLVRLRDLGNTLIVVEHDEDTIRLADWVVDIGPGAGEHGGQVVVSGPVEDLLAAPDSLTGALPLRPPRDPDIPAVRRPPYARAASSSSRAPASTTCATST